MMQTIGLPMGTRMRDGTRRYTTCHAHRSRQHRRAELGNRSAWTPLQSATAWTGRAPRVDAQVARLFGQAHPSSHEASRLRS
jgi:hypothetical protein